MTSPPEKTLSVPLGHWKCPVGHKGSTFFTVGWKNGQQISEINTCGMCGTFDGWRIDDKGDTVYLLEMPDPNDV